MPDLATINAEAGNHAFPQDTREVGLALRAGQSVWQQFPYLGKRFGERGQRFTHSDSGWLVTLCHLEQAAATRSLDWLRGVLSSRGIPTVILEAHLLAIMQELMREFPGRPDMPMRYAPFLAAREAERLALWPAGGRAPLLGRFEAQLETSPGVRVPSAAWLLASAWVDEHAGVEGALANPLAWMQDPARFGAEWIATINAWVASLGPPGRPPC
jgi:hypothetical protein